MSVGCVNMGRFPTSYSYTQALSLPSPPKLHKPTLLTAYISADSNQSASQPTSQPVSTFHWVINPIQDNITWSQADYSFPGETRMCSAQLNTTPPAQPIQQFQLQFQPYCTWPSPLTVPSPPLRGFSSHNIIPTESEAVD